MRLIWEKVNEWKFWALANGRDDFYRLLLENKINSTKGLVYLGTEPYLSMSIPAHQILKNKAKGMLDPLTFQEFVQEMYYINT